MYVGDVALNLPLTTEILNSENDAYLQQTYCIDVEGYKLQAEEAYNNDNRSKPWDSNSLKEEYNVPTYNFYNSYGGNYISGEGSTSGAAYTDAASQYATYKQWVNVFHLTGQHLFKLGTRDTIEATYEKTAYHATSTNSAIAAAEGLLEAESDWYAAQGQLDSEGVSLARSGLKSVQAISPINWDGNSCAGSWKDALGVALPVDPASVGTQAKQYFAKGHNSSAADTAFLSEKCTQCSEGLITETQTKTTISFSGSITGVGATNGEALTNAMNALNTYSNTQYNLYGTGFNQSRTSPVNTAGTDAHNFFTTGATTYLALPKRLLAGALLWYIFEQSWLHKTHAFDSIAKYQWGKIVKVW